MEWHQILNNLHPVIMDATKKWAKGSKYDVQATEYYHGIAVGLIRALSRLTIMCDAPYEIVSEYYAMVDLEVN